MWLNWPMQGYCSRPTLLGYCSRPTLLRSRPGSMRRDWTSVVCFSCGKVGHSTTRCPALDAYFPFMLPGWKAEKEGGGYVMISPRVIAECRRGGGDGGGRGWSR